MGAVSWLFWLLLSAGAVAASMIHYRRRETPGRGRLLLALLRGAALALVLLLIFDPELPAGASGAAGGTQVLLDASLSMSLPGRDTTRWGEAVGVARERAGDRSVLLFGDRARPVPAGALPDSAPGDIRSRLLPGLQAAAEAGVRRVVVITDGGIEDADAVTRWLPRLGLDVETIAVGAATADNRSLTEVSAPAWVEPGAAVPVRFGVVGNGTDSLAVTIRQGERVVGRTVVPGAAVGRIATGGVDVRVDAPPGGGWVRLDVALEGTDSIADDDLRSVYVQAAEEPAGIAMVSFRPDWEPRFLAPVLTNALGLPLRAWLRSATGQYTRLGTGLEAGASATEADVRRALDRAQLVVLHGLGIDAPQWAHEAARQSRHVLVFPADDSPELPLELGGEMTGDFFPSGDVPSSPLAPLLTDLVTAGATPLNTVRQAAVPDGAWVLLTATRGRQGPPVPLVVAGQTGGRRWAVSLGSGYWIWAFRGGSERQLHTRLWSALGGWLAQERSVAALPAVRPAAMSVPRGEALPWIAPGVPADSVRVQLLSDGGVVADTILRRAGSDTMYSSAPAPGHYSYRATAFAGDNVLEAEGLLTVERYSPELTRPSVDPATLVPTETMLRDDAASLRRGRPLHATAYPWILLVAILAAEWILRRRWGLR